MPLLASNDNFEPVNKGGRPPFEPTEYERMEVQCLSGLGLPKVDIAARIGDGIADETLLGISKKKLLVAAHMQMRK